MVELDIGQITATLTPKDRLVGLMVQDVEVGLKKSTTLPCSILEKVLMTMGEVNTGLRPDLIPPIIQVILVYHHVFISMVILTDNLVVLKMENCKPILMVKKTEWSKFVGYFGLNIEDGPSRVGKYITYILSLFVLYQDLHLYSPI